MKHAFVILALVVAAHRYQAAQPEINVPSQPKTAPAASAVEVDKAVAKSVNRAVNQTFPAIQGSQGKTFPAIQGSFPAIQE